MKQTLPLFLSFISLFFSAVILQYMALKVHLWIKRRAPRCLFSLSSPVTKKGRVGHINHHIPLNKKRLRS